MSRMFALHGQRSSLVIELPPGGAPLWRYWGPRLADDFAPGSSLADEAAVNGFMLEKPARLELMPASGTGWFGESALEARRSGGQHFSFRATEVEVDEGTDRLGFTLRDSVSLLELRLVIRLDKQSDVLTISSSLLNAGMDDVHLAWLASAVLPLSDETRDIRYYGGRYAGEFELQEERLGKATWSRENRRGITSHDNFPGAVVTTGGATAHAGLVFAAQLAWSGNHRQAIEWLEDGRRQWQLGEALAPGEICLVPGELHEAPEVLATCSAAGWQGAARNFHKAVRQRLAWRPRGASCRPVHFNTWEGFYFDHDEKALFAAAERAAALGVERFVLDDGWFEGRNDDRQALGDWRPDARKFPRGLGPLAQHVSALGMAFGLWIEPEMISPDSALHRAHPDWVLQITGRTSPLSRNQLVLDIGNPAVSDHIFETLSATIEGIPLAYLKWDHNRDLAPAAAGGRAANRRQTLAFYDLLARFRQAFPDIEIESCAGGGGRIDAGAAKYVHRFWPSDCLDALSRISIQRGFLQFFPPELMGAHIGSAPAHTTGRWQSLDFRAAVACQGHLGIELDLRALGETDEERIRQWISFYKLWRPLLHADTWTGEAPDNIAWHAAGSEAEWLLFVYRTAPTTRRFAPPVRLPFVDRESRYEVELIEAGHCGGKRLIDGSWLQSAGLATVPIQAERALVYHGQSL